MKSVPAIPLPTFTVRGPFELGSAPELQPVVNAMFAAGVEEGPLAFDLVSRPEPFGTDKVLVATLDPGSDLIGFATYRPHDHGGQWLDLLYVRPEYRRGGVGQALLSRVIAEAEALGAANLLTMTTVGNAGMRAFMEDIGIPAVGILYGKPLTGTPTQ